MRRLLAAASLSAVAAAQAPEAPAKVSFVAEVLPILEQRCFDCHRSSHESGGRLRKPKGNLALDGVSAILAGGDGGPVLTLGKPEQSPLYTRTVLPAEHDDRMPGKGEPLTAAQTDLLRRWIREGADFGGWLGVRAGAQPQQQPQPQPQPQPALPDRYGDLAKGLSAPASTAVVRATAGGKLTVTPLAAGSPLLRVDAAGHREEVGDPEVEALRAVQANVAIVDLAGTGIGHQACAVLARFPRLVRLDLRNTAVADRGIAALADAPALRVLNLFATGASDRSVPYLLQMRALETVYVWQSKLTDAGLARLRQDPRGIEVVAEPRWPAAEVDAPADRRRRR